jgi:hypothetical protein
MVIFPSMSFSSAVRGVGFAANEPLNLVLHFTPPRIVTSGVPQRVEKVTPMLLLDVTGAQRLAWRSSRAGRIPCQIDFLAPEVKSCFVSLFDLRNRHSTR